MDLAIEVSYLEIENYGDGGRVRIEIENCSATEEEEERKTAVSSCFRCYLTR